MINPLKGETSVKAGDVSYVLRYTANSLCELENALNMNLAEIGAMFSRPQSMRISTMRTLFWAGLIDAQPAMTEKVAGDIMTSMGIPNTLIEVMKAFTAAFPVSEATSEENPPKARRRGTGKG